MSVTSLTRESLKASTGGATAGRPAEPAQQRRSSSRPDDAAPAAASEQPARRRVSDFWVYAALTLLTWGAWKFTRLGLFTAGDDIGYWLGVAGGVMMLLLFSYPMRKHLRFTHRWGKVKWWFLVHMLLGVGGPLLILLHSNFQVGSLNAAAALYSMIIVALSGVVGRFIYSHVNRGLHGELTSFGELTVRAGLHQREARSHLRFAPGVEERLHAFGQRELTAQPGFFACLRRAFWLPVKQWLTYYRCMARVRTQLKKLALETGWDHKSLAKRERLARKLVRRYLNAAVRVAHYTAYERLFSLWHVAHLPFVYLLLFSGIAHVVAVHAY